MSKVRVRFAPSPTGLPHLGNVRTALFNWLFAQANQGTFILRFEDTDRERLVPESIDYIQEGLKWLGLNWDEGPNIGGPHAPYVQSERLELYTKRAEILQQSDWLYPCWCSPERLDKLRKKAMAEKKAYKYDRHCLSHPSHPDEPHVLRFKIDNEFDPEWEDIVRGPLSQKGSDLDDFVCIKSDGYPTYNFANVIDDYLMEVSHVIRGEEFISSTPKFLQIYQAFDWQPPKFAHLPPVLGPDKAKLSKRHGSKPVLDYHQEGYLPSAVINFLASLGWNDGTTQELYTINELIDSFTLERVQKSPAVFDENRLEWFNSQHLRQLPVDQLEGIIKDHWSKQAEQAPRELKQRVLEITKDRLRHLSELAVLTAYYFDYPSLSAKTVLKLKSSFESKVEDQTLDEWLRRVSGLLATEATTTNSYEQPLKELVTAQSGPAKAYWEILRIVISGGQEHTPPIWELIYALGTKETKQRLEQTCQLL